ncbi:MAG: T9SS type A sorting domain-containing protein [Ignavibacteria bacterium]|nr:T9SS type A sorting domain-containing protein [Ignavibacteria bacterium]
MKNKLLLFALFILFSALMYAQNKPQISFEELILRVEENPQFLIEARMLTAQLDIPHTIYLPEGIFIQAMGVENNKVVYAIYNNMLDIYDNGETAFWTEIANRFDLTKARVHILNKPTQNSTLGFPEPQENPLLTEMLIIPDWTSDGVMTFDATTGDLLNQNFIIDPTNLSSPKEANLAPWGNITVSDQIDDGVMEYDTAGTFIIFFAPAGGVNNAILDNIRGHNFRPNGNLVVTVGGGANDDAVAEFDNTGTYLGNFIANAAGGLNSPFDIIFRSSDCLVSASSSNAVHRYDLSGNFIDLFVPSISFPQQVFEMSNGNVAVAGFSTPSGIYIYSSTGTLLNTLTGVSGPRSVYQLPNGNFITTNGAGVYELDGTTGNLIRTIVSGVSAQYVSLYDYNTIPVELTSFRANVVGNNVELSWSTATETNNQGFEIERSENNIEFNNIGFVPGFGTTTETKSYSYTDQSINSGTHYYRLKQIDFDGSFNYSDVVEAVVSLPTAFNLEQNYPNPFNPSTSIQFSLPVDAQITINVYNLVGEKVAEVANGNFAAGSQKVTFNASALTSGIYFYRLDATANNGQTFSDVRKMSLLK